MGGPILTKLGVRVPYIPERVKTKNGVNRSTANHIMLTLVIFFDTVTTPDWVDRF